MKIKKRLMIAFLIITLVPVGLSISIGTMLIKYQEMLMKQSYHVSGDTVQIILNPMRILDGITSHIYEEITKVLNEDPDTLNNQEQLQEWNEKLKRLRSYLVVRKDQEYIYIGDREKFSELMEKLPMFGSYVKNDGGNSYMDGEFPAFLKFRDFYFKNKEQGTVFIITDFNALAPQLRHFVLEFAVAFPLILILTAALLTVWIYRGILKPLNVLKIATHEIREGNLDSPILSDSDNEIGLLCKDFEQMRLKLKEQSRTSLQYEQDMRDLIRNISHDLKTPLTTIKGYSEGLLDGVAGTEERRRKYLQTIYNKAEDMTSLVDELSIYSQFDCNTIPYNFQRINLDNYFTDCVSELQLDLELKQIELNYMNYMDHDLEIVADPEQLKRVINNIIGNSVKYMGKKKGIISIRIRKTGIPQESTRVLVEIEDNGSGIKEQELTNIFERFYRTDTSRNSSKGGSGLGLAIVKKIIEDHGGIVYATGKENVGTCIYFTLEIAEKQKEQRKEVMEDEQNINY